MSAAPSRQVHTTAGLPSIDTSRSLQLCPFAVLITLPVTLLEEPTTGKIRTRTRRCRIKERQHRMNKDGTTQWSHFVICYKVASRSKTSFTTTFSILTSSFVPKCPSWHCNTLNDRKRKKKCLGRNKIDFLKWVWGVPVHQETERDLISVTARLT